MDKRIVFTYIFLLIVVGAKSQTANFNVKQIGLSVDCKPIIEFSVIAPVVSSTYAWDFGDGNMGTGTTVTNTYVAKGAYNVTAVVDGDVANQLTESIKPWEMIISATRDNTTFGLSTYAYRIGCPILASPSGYTFNWSVDDVPLVPAITDSEFAYTFPAAGGYKVNVIVTSTAPPGCTFSSDKSVVVEDSLSVPNVFSPDGDGVNDVWSIVSNGKDKLSVKIYSRAGALVYEEHAAVVRWDGKTLFGQELIDGVYYYVVDRDDKVLAPQKGFLYLFRGK
ncbi:T9SS type B sorting domain-containing protein [Williamwhitmania taraxaci]|uniref:Gliding motility-associated C-terminal domain-containing protein n=1 Tax=Williamwhitmania taraxaci TaxID=1640674 RepID=A0A1G6LG83_9BACT|nr:gliding motility-associated C-terminal domain-containing protein [Williamwhitmania taraxaci]SDC41586.1 gliding motility-associated C-terminal domain-containing protein [Williamwhitmania taraxaci]